MHEVIQPSLLIIPAASTASSSTDQIERGDSEAMPLPANIQCRNSVLEFLEKESGRPEAKERRPDHMTL